MEVPLGDYSGQPFEPALGEVYGYRLWRTDPMCTLRPRNLAFAAPWSPGPNQAHCRRDLYDQVTNRFATWAAGPSANANSLAASFRHAADTMRARGMSVPAPPQTHDAPDESCRCGFYAYFRADDPEALNYCFSRDMVLGTIKGYGRTLIGSRGFRCEKAEITALLDLTAMPVQEGRMYPAYRDHQRNKTRALRYIYPDVPMVPSLAALMEFVPDQETQ